MSDPKYLPAMHDKLVFHFFHDVNLRSWLPRSGKLYSNPWPVYPSKLKSHIQSLCNFNIISLQVNSLLQTSPDNVSITLAYSGLFFENESRFFNNYITITSQVKFNYSFRTSRVEILNVYTVSSYPDASVLQCLCKIF